MKRPDEIRLESPAEEEVEFVRLLTLAQDAGREQIGGLVEAARECQQKSVRLAERARELIAKARSHAAALDASFVAQVKFLSKRHPQVNPARVSAVGLEEKDGGSAHRIVVALGKRAALEETPPADPATLVKTLQAVQPPPTKRRKAKK